jgi:hypothetical protein
MGPKQQKFSIGYVLATLLALFPIQYPRMVTATER